jgi:hypothetical protein
VQHQNDSSQAACLKSHLFPCNSTFLLTRECYSSVKGPRWHFLAPRGPRLIDVPDHDLPRSPFPIGKRKYHMKSFPPQSIISSSLSFSSLSSISQSSNTYDYQCPECFPPSLIHHFEHSSSSSASPPAATPTCFSHRSWLTLRKACTRPSCTRTLMSPLHFPFSKSDWST